MASNEIDMIMCGGAPLCFDKPVVQVKGEDGLVLSVYEFANGTYKFMLGHSETVGNVLINVPKNIFLTQREIDLLKMAFEELDSL